MSSGRGAFPVFEANRREKAIPFWPRLRQRAIELRRLSLAKVAPPIQLQLTASRSCHLSDSLALDVAPLYVTLAHVGKALTWTIADAPTAV